MADIIKVSDLVDAKIDAEKLGEAASEDKVVEPRYGDPYASIPMVSRRLIEMSVPNAKYYLTKALLDADLSNVENDQYAMVVNDLDSDIQPTEFNGFYQKQAGSWVYLAWNPLTQFLIKLQEVLTESKQYTDEKVQTKVLSLPIDFLLFDKSKKYYIASDAVFSSSTNTPSVVSSIKHGILEQHVFVDDNVECVIYFSNGDKCYYVNTIVAGVWSGWTAIQNFNYLQNYIASLVSTNPLITPQVLSTIDDFHNIKNQGYYKIATNGVVNNALNAPNIGSTTKHGILTVYNISDSNRTLMFYSFADATIQVKYFNGAWSTWKIFKPDNLNICSNGATLRRLRAKLGHVKNGGGVLKIAIGGDSWTEQTPITQAFIDLIAEKYTKIGDGWISVHPNWHIGNSVVNTNFTLYDASAASAPCAYLTGIDGNCIYTTRTDSTCVVSNISGTQITIYYYDGNGRFNYILDGGSSVSVIGTETNTFKKVVLSGLSDTPHNLTINTSGNTGTVAIHGFYSVKTNTAGVQFFRIGNGGLRSKTMQNYYANVGYFASDIVIDTYINILGTNDAREADSDKSVYRDTLTQLIANYKAAVGEMSIILCSPAQSSQTEVNPLSGYDDVVRELAVTRFVEYYSLFLQFGSYGSASALGMWQADKIHPTQAMGRVVAHCMNADLLKL